jgi:cytochrome c-type biogenesis protein CcmH
LTLWIVLTTLIAMTCAALAVAVTRSRERAQDEGVEDAAVADEAVRVRLADIEAQAASGAMSRETADGLRTEAIRGYLASRADAPGPRRSLSRPAQMGLAVGLAGLVALGAALLYAKLGRPMLAAAQAPAETAQTGGLGGAGGAGGLSLAQITARLEARVRAQPADLKALQFLAWSYAQAGRWAEAAMTYHRAGALAGADPQDGAAEGEALTQAAGGTVTDPAIAAIRATLGRDPQDARARYLEGLYREEHGDHPGAMAEWIALLKTAPADAPWAPQVRAFVEKAAAEHGEDISKLLPPAGGAGAGAGGPDPQAMVDRLAARLAQEPHDLAGWVMMMRARMVLGEGDEAAKAYRAATAAFAASPADQTRLTAAAKVLRVPGT